MATLQLNLKLKMEIKLMLRYMLFTLFSFFLFGCSTPTKINYYQEKPENFATFSATGYAPVNTQHGTTHTEKLLNAINASKLDAYRELTAQIHGHQINSQAKFNDLIISNSSLTASIEGLIRGARVVRSYPVNDEIYATELELDYEELYLLYNSSALPRQIINE